MIYGLDTAYFTEGSQMRRVLYFDIDGVILSYDDTPKRAIVGGHLEASLKRLGFTHLVCASGWAQLVRMARPYGTADDHKWRIWYRTAGDRPNGDAWDLDAGEHPVFPDKEWFFTKLELVMDPDHRCQEIDLGTDWYYVDDLADRYFTDSHGQAAFTKELGHRICMPDRYSDGADVLKWLDSTIQCP